ncbi:hypothetical protein [Brucella pseudogrignonensis]|uniref:Uncharacterized protein n=1 Tax=Brucella pseudogrignonensis TaxID=419475 RepID=A0ABU1M5H2_9HYPH|nr:hypothetical protein [Brucella pseudogrignonensis]MDR6431279.1 hypothetical protein [Brucella pseudogrignonensis]
MKYISLILLAELSFLVFCFWWTHFPRKRMRHALERVYYARRVSDALNMFVSYHVIAIVFAAFCAASIYSLNLAAS